MANTVLAVAVVLQTIVVAALWHERSAGADDDALTERITAEVSRSLARHHSEVVDAVVAAAASLQRGPGSKPLPPVGAGTEAKACQERLIEPPVRHTPAHADRDQAVASANELITIAVGNGRWTLDDTTSLQPYLDKLSPDDRIALLERFLTAVNAQQLDIDGVMPAL